MIASFHELAERELGEATEFYNRQRAGLGVAFATEIERSVSAILEHPEAGRVIRGDVRRRLCLRFPYTLLYAIRPGVVRILAVMHLKRQPTYWVTRS